MAAEPFTLRASFNPTSSRYLAGVEPKHKEVAIAIGRKADRVRMHAEEHFQSHRKTWTDREYNKLVGKQGQQPELKPRGAPSRDLSREAAQNVQRRHATRIARHYPCRATHDPHPDEG